MQRNGTLDLDYTRSSAHMRQNHYQKEVSQNDNRSKAPDRVSTTSFFDLPRELRDQIYEETWKPGVAFDTSLPTMRDRQSYYRFTICYGEVQPNELSKPKDFAWVFANRQMLTEASECFDSQAIWRDVPLQEKSVPSFAVWRPSERQDPEKQEIPVFLSIQRAQSIVLHGPLSTYAYFISPGQDADIPLAERRLRRLDLPPLDYTKTPAKFTTSVLFDVQSTHFLSDFARGLEGSTALKRLSIWIFPRAYRPECVEHRVKVDLNVLKDLKLPNLRVLELETHVNREFWLDASVREEFKREVESVGRVLLGEDVDITTGLEACFRDGIKRTSQWKFVKK